MLLFPALAFTLRALEGDEVDLGGLDDYDEMRRVTRRLDRAAALRPLALVFRSELAACIANPSYLLVDTPADAKKLEYLDIPCIVRNPSGHLGPNIAFIMGPTKSFSKISKSREKYLKTKIRREPPRLSRWPAEGDGYVVEDDVENAIRQRQDRFLLLPFNAPLVDNAAYIFDLDKTPLPEDDDEDLLEDDDDDEDLLQAEDLLLEDDDDDEDDEDEDLRRV